MRWRWLARRGAPGLLVFFNGWGMDERSVADLDPPAGADLLVVHDYGELEPGELCRAVEAYASYSVVAWSLGVWAAATLVAAAGRAPQQAVAVNGTCRPIDEACGIPPWIFRETVERCSAATRESFERRMCGGAAALSHFRDRDPARTIDDQAVELRALEQQILATPAPSPAMFTRAIVGARDRILPPENQRRSWGPETEVHVLPIPHYPFFDLRGWGRILDGGSDR